MLQFEVGKIYTVRSISNHECIWEYTVLARTVKTVTLGHRGEQLRRKIFVLDGVERVMPKGNYSMAPTLSADVKKEVPPATVRILWQS